MQTHTHTGSGSAVRVDPLEVRVTGPDCEPVSDADLRRIFPGGMLTQTRLDRLRQWPRVVVMCGERVVALATCQKTETELRVPEIGLDTSCGCGMHEVLNALLDAVELAGLAGGCRRIVLMPPKAGASLLERRGYEGISERCAGGWLEKALV
jgi:hypothetical protein